VEAGVSVGGDVVVIDDRPPGHRKYKRRKYKKRKYYKKRKHRRSKRYRNRHRRDFRR
jgi:hypothetical protein